jgi:protein-L-isoaspartate(D-aspartate) O-methyltransferase
MQRLIAELRQSGIADERVLGAIANVDRERFVTPAFAERAWENTALPIAFGQTISQPLVVAAMTEALNVGPRMKVLEIGTGSGYQAAVLAELAGTVYTIEIVESLAREATARFEAMGYRNIVAKAGDGYQGWPEHAPFDAIMVTAATEHVPQPLLDQLRPGGRLVIPIGSQLDGQTLAAIDKQLDGKFEKREILAVRFVPLTRNPPQ